MSVLQVPMLQLRGTTEQWAIAEQILGDGQIGVERTSGGVLVGFKVGNGTDAWGALPYASSTSLAGMITTISGGTPEEVLSLLSAIAEAANLLLFIQPFDEEAEDWSPIDADQFLITSSATPLATNVYPVKRVPGEDWAEINNSFSGTDDTGAPISRTFAQSNVVLDAAKSLLSLTPAGSFSITIDGNTRAIKVNPTANSTISGITGLAEGQTILLRFKQDGTGILTFTKPSGWEAGVDTVVAGDSLDVETGAGAITEFTLTGMESSGVKIRKVLS